MLDSRYTTCGFFLSKIIPRSRGALMAIFIILSKRVEATDESC